MKKIFEFFFLFILINYVLTGIPSTITHTNTIFFFTTSFIFITKTSIAENIIKKPTKTVLIYETEHVFHTRRNDVFFTETYSILTFTVSSITLTVH